MQKLFSFSDITSNKYKLLLVNFFFASNPLKTSNKNHDLKAFIKLNYPMKLSRAFFNLKLSMLQTIETNRLLSTNGQNIKTVSNSRDQVWDFYLHLTIKNFTLIVQKQFFFFISSALDLKVYNNQDSSVITVFWLLSMSFWNNKYHDAEKKLNCRVKLERRINLVIDVTMPQQTAGLKILSVLCVRQLTYK